MRRRLTAAITAGYVLRTMLFRFRVRRWPKETVLVFDRYFYDNLVHYDRGMIGVPLTLFTSAIPTPTLAVLLLVREPTILDRRPGYSEEYVNQLVPAYEELPHRFPGLVVMRTDDPGSIASVGCRIANRVLAGAARTTDR